MHFTGRYRIIHSYSTAREAFINNFILVAGQALAAQAAINQQLQAAEATSQALALASYVQQQFQVPYTAPVVPTGRGRNALKGL